jgi:hypothetical protein
MAQVTLLASSVVLGMLVVGIVLLTARWRTRGYVPDGGAEAEGTLLERAASNETVWIVAFLALVGVALGGAVFYVSGASVPIPGGAGLLLAALLGTIVFAYFFWGVYHSSRYKGLHRPAALAVTAWMVGMAVVGLVVLRLVGVL